LTFKVSTDVKVYSKQEGTYQCVGGAQGSRFRVASQEADLSIAKLEDFSGTLKDDLIEVIWQYLLCSFQERDTKIRKVFG
jgi:hypothetical protein